MLSASLNKTFPSSSSSSSFSSSSKTYEEPTVYLETAREHPTGRLWVDCFVKPTLLSLMFLRGELNGDFLLQGAGCSSVDSVPAFEAVGRRIDPSQWTQLQFGLFSVPTSGPQLVYQRPWYVLHIKDPLLHIEKSSLCGDSGFPTKKCVNVAI